MKTWTTILAGLLAAGWALTCAAVTSSASVDAAIQAVQQAPDPSAAVTAYANGFTVARDDPRLYEAYVSRMVDLGLPELAYHQAQTLTTLQSTNGLAWAVVAHVEARRAQMPEALSAINLAGQYAPDNKFVQHTAGELAAWYDFKADKGTIPENTKDGLNSLRHLMQQRPAFTEAYATAQKAYQASAGPTPSSSEAPAPYAAAPTPAVTNAPPAAMAPQVPMEPVAPSVYAPPATAPPPYYPDYSSAYYYPGYADDYYGWGAGYGFGWGPGWVSPAPWWWWQPCGWWGGFGFFPFSTVFVFDVHNHDHDHDGHGHDGHSHDGHSGHNEQFAHNHDPSTWHNGSQGHNAFFGTPAHPSDSVTRWAHASSTARVAATPSASAAGTGSHWWGTVNHPTTMGTAGSSATMHSSPQGFVHQGPAASGTMSRSWSGTWQTAPSTSHSWGSGTWGRNSMAPRSTWSVPGVQSPGFSTPRFAAPSQGFSGSMGSFHSFNNGMSAAPHSFGGFSGMPGGGSFGGGFHSAAPMSGGGFHSAAPMGGSGFHGGGGAMSGGGHGGGGHR